MLAKLYCFILGALIFFAACNSSENELKQVASISSKLGVLQESVRRYPDSLMLVYDLIEEYRNEGYYDSAIALTDSQIKLDSGNAYLWNIKATLFFENEDTVNAIKSLEHAIEIYPLPEYLVALGTIYAEIKNRNSLLIADELLEINKTKSGKDAYFIKGLYYNFINEPKKAIIYLDSCLQLNYTYMYAYREKAIALYHLEKYEEAITVLKKAVTLKNNYDEGYYWLGKCYEKLNKKEDAIQSYQNALLYDKNYTEAREALNRLKYDV